MEIKLRTDDLVTVVQAAKTLKCTRQTIYRWIHAGKVTTADVAGATFIPKSEVERLKMARAPAGTGTPNSQGGEQ
jgi:excisionase family DNA binding protein